MRTQENIMGMGMCGEGLNRKRSEKKEIGLTEDFYISVLM